LRIPTAAVALACMLTGCIPYWTYLYYHPSGDFPEVRRNRCPTAPDTVEFSFAEVVAHVRTHDSSNGLTIVLGFHVPERHKVRLVADDLLIRLDDGETRRVRPADMSMKDFRAPAEAMVPTAPMIGASVRVSAGSTRTIPRHFIATSDLGAIEAARFHLSPVELEIDKQPSRLSEITFTRKRHHMIMAGINC
jgi:hypothetical protein